nr:hypothetical protein [Tanacetum cinerariifolium]
MGRDTVQLETAVSTISQEYLLEFTSKYGISEAHHPKLPGPEDMIVDFPEGKVGVYTKFFEFANFHLPLSQFLFDILGYYQIHLSQLSVIGAAKVSHFEINCRVLNIVPTLTLFRVFYTPSFNSGWMSFSKRRGKNTPQCYTKPLDSLKNWNNRFFWVDERVFPTIMDWRTNAPKDRMPVENMYSPEAVIILSTHRTSIQKQPDVLLCLVGLSGRYYLGDEVYLTFLHDDDRDMDLFKLIRALNPTKSTGPENQEAAAPEVPPSKNVTTMEIAPEAGPAKRVAAIDPPTIKERRKRSHDGVDTNAPPKVLKRDHADPRPTESTRGGKSLAAIELGMGSTRPTPAPQGAHVDVSDPDPLSFADPQSRPSTDVTQSSKGAVAARDPKSENTSFSSMVGSPESIYRPKWGITNGSILDAPEACQDLVDHIAPPEFFSELRHLHNNDFLKQYNVNLVRQVAMGSQLRLRFEQEAKLLKKSVAQVACQDKRIQARENEIKNLEALLEAETDMKKAAENKKSEVSPSGSAREPEGRTNERDNGLPAGSVNSVPVLPSSRSLCTRSHAEKKKKYRVVCRTHGVESAHHARSDGVPVSVPTVSSQGLAILLADAATQTETDEASPHLLRSSSLPVIHG